MRGAGNCPPFFLKKMYTTKHEILAKVPKIYLDNSLLDESGDSIMSEEQKEASREEVWQAIVDNAADQIHTYLGQQYAVPFSTPYPAVVKAASLIFVLESLFQRRAYTGEANSYTEQATQIRAKLDRIGQGLEPLQAGMGKKSGGVVIASLPTRAHSRRNS